MTGLKALTLAGAAVLAVMSGASAADLLPPPPVEPPPPIIQFSGWYLRGDIGFTSAANDPDLANYPALLPGFNPEGLPFSSSTTSVFNNSTISEGGMFDVGVGYQFTPWLRGDITLELRGGSAFQSLQTLNDPVSPATEYAAFYRGNISSVIGMANLYGDIGTWYGITPFIGAGIGMAQNSVRGFTDQGYGYANDGNTFLGPNGSNHNDGLTNQLAWSLMTGIDFNVTPNLKIELGYRYLNYGKINTGPSNCLSAGPGGPFNIANCGGGVENHLYTTNSLASNDFKVGFIWMLGDQVPPPPPLVRKY